MTDKKKYFSRVNSPVFAIFDFWIKSYIKKWKMKNEKRKLSFLITSLHKPRYYTDHACILLRMLLDVLLYICISDSIFCFKICKCLAIFYLIVLNSFILLFYFLKTAVHFIISSSNWFEISAYFSLFNFLFLRYSFFFLLFRAFLYYSS